MEARVREQAVMPHDQRRAKAMRYNIEAQSAAQVKAGMGRLRLRVYTPTTYHREPDAASNRHISTRKHHCYSILGRDVYVG